MVTEMMAVAEKPVSFFLCILLLMQISLVRQDKDLSSHLLSLLCLIVFIPMFLQCHCDSVSLQFEVKGRKRDGKDVTVGERKIGEKERKEGSVGRRGIT